MGKPGGGRKGFQKNLTANRGGVWRGSYWRASNLTGGRELKGGITGKLKVERTLRVNLSLHGAWRNLFGELKEKTHSTGNLGRKGA